MDKYKYPSLELSQGDSYSLMHQSFLLIEHWIYLACYVLSYIFLLPSLGKVYIAANTVTKVTQHEI